MRWDESFKHSSTYHRCYSDSNDDDNVDDKNTFCHLFHLIYIKNGSVCVKLHRTTWNWNSNCRAISSVKTHIFSILVNFVVFQSNIVSYIVTQNAIWLNRNDKMYQTMRCISIFVSTIDTTNEHFQIMWLDQNENSIVTNSEELFGIYKMHHWFAIIVANADCKHTNPLNSMQ